MEVILLEGPSPLPLLSVHYTGVVTNSLNLFIMSARSASVSTCGRHQVTPLCQDHLPQRGHLRFSRQAAPHRLHPQDGRPFREDTPTTTTTSPAPSSGPAAPLGEDIALADSHQGRRPPTEAWAGETPLEQEPPKTSRPQQFRDEEARTKPVPAPSLPPPAKRIKIKRPGKRSGSDSNNNSSSSATSSFLSSSSSKINSLVNSTWDNIKTEKPLATQVKPITDSPSIKDMLTRPLSFHAVTSSSGVTAEGGGAKVKEASGCTPAPHGEGGARGGKPLPPEGSRTDDDTAAVGGGGSSKVAKEVGVAPAAPVLSPEASSSDSHPNQLPPDAQTDGIHPPKPLRGGDRTGTEVEVHEGSSLGGGGGSGRFEFDRLFSYYPPKLVLLDGDLCPERSLSVSDMERSKLSSLPSDHPFLGWSLGQPTMKPNPPTLKPNRRRGRRVA